MEPNDGNEHQTQASYSEQPVQVHLNLLQNVIGRMASNSAAVKTWCVTVVSAILVIVDTESNSNVVLLALVPIFFFLSLDVYYLALERGFRSSYNDFVRKLHRGEVKSEDLFLIEPKGMTETLRFGSLNSFSVWPFYIVLAVVVVVARLTVYGSAA